jgi:hypothetical protein
MNLVWLQWRRGVPRIDDCDGMSKDEQSIVLFKQINSVDRSSEESERATAAVADENVGLAV